ncbi:hypothetical protein T265_09194, partial [Opisthorchis viverrini]
CITSQHMQCRPELQPIPQKGWEREQSTEMNFSYIKRVKVLITSSTLDIMRTTMNEATRPQRNWSSILWH